MKSLKFSTAYHGMKKPLFVLGIWGKEGLFQKEILQVWLIRLVTMVLLVAHSSCNKNCASIESSLFYQDSYGTWRLVKIVSPTRTQTVFAQKQTLKVYFSNGRLPGPNTKEAIFSDTTTVAKNEWLSYDPDCKNRSFVVTYDNITSQRKYWVNENADELRATGYVSQVGSKADSLMYYYVPDK